MHERKKKNTQRPTVPHRDDPTVFPILLQFFVGFAQMFFLFLSATAKNEANLSLLQLAAAVPRPFVDAPIICIVDMLCRGAGAESGAWLASDRADTDLSRQLRMRLKLHSRTLKANSS